MAILSEKAWRRHSHPVSGWTRVLVIPLLAAGLYLHNPWILGLVVMWVIINPFVFPAPKSINNWMSKGVVGEQLYYKDRKYIKKDLPTLLNFLNVPVFLLFLYLGWMQMLVPMILAGVLAMVIKFWFIDRMVQVYEKRGI